MAEPTQPMIDAATRVVLDEQIRTRLAQRRWHRSQTFAWRDMERENRTILLELLRIRRRAKAAATVRANGEAEWDRRKGRYDSAQDLDRFLVHEPIGLGGDLADGDHFRYPE